MEWTGDNSKVIFTVDGQLWTNLPEYKDEITCGSIFSLSYSILRTYFELEKGFLPEKAKLFSRFLTSDFSIMINDMLTREITENYKDTWHLTSTRIDEWRNQRHNVD